MARLFYDFQGGELGAALTDSGTTLTSDALASLPAVSSPDFVAITLDPDGIESSPEIAYITAHTASATTATISRGEEGTTAVAHSSGIEWVAPVTAGGAEPLEYITVGTGSPEGAVTAPVGSLFLRTDGGTSTTLYVKESGTGNTGWVAK